MLRPLLVQDEISKAVIIVQTFLMVLLIHPCLMEHRHGPIQSFFTTVWTESYMSGTPSS